MRDRRACETDPVRGKTGLSMEEKMNAQPVSCNCQEHYSGQENYSRLDEQDDSLFYEQERFVSHLDSKALAAAEELIGGLIVEERPVILDLMAGWDSHIPESVKPERAVGLGLNKKELDANKSLTEYIIHDLNADPVLPWADNTFDVVLNTVSVDYLTSPQAVFKEVERVLKPGGLFLVIFSNRMFQQKAVKIWREATEDQRLDLARDLFAQTGNFNQTSTFISKGKPRPADDKYAGVIPCSDPIYAVYAEKKGGDPARRARPRIDSPFSQKADPDELEAKKREIKQNHCCPYCGQKMEKWEVPDNPFIQTWDNDFMYICFNDECPYYVRGWDVMTRQTKGSMSYRLMYNPENDCCLPIPVPTPLALREGIIE